MACWTSPRKLATILGAYRYPSQTHVRARSTTVSPFDIRMFRDFVKLLNGQRSLDIALKGAVAQLLMREFKPLLGMTRSRKPDPASS